MRAAAPRTTSALMPLLENQLVSTMSRSAVSSISAASRWACGPSNSAAAQASIAHLKRSDTERQLQRRRVAQLRAGLDAQGIPHLPNPSHIIPVMVGDPVKCKFISDTLLRDYGIYIQPINYPTVPVGTERLRLTPSPVHDDGDIDRLIHALSDIWSQCELARGSVAA